MNIKESLEISMQELKNIEFGLLKEFKSFCEENNIRYFLAYGTLLGAIRYKGFIPWDDDLDVLVPREDYNRLIELYLDNGHFILFSIERNKKFAFPFAKLSDMTTRKYEGVEGRIDSGVKIGVDIDIFPLDYWNDDIEKTKEEIKKITKNIKWLNITKTSISKARTPLRRFVRTGMHICGRIIGSEYWCKKIIRSVQSQKKSCYMGNKVWIPYKEKDIIPAEVFADSIEVEFEGEKFPAPIGYDTYLTCLYGDYLPEPPKEKQRTHHIFTAYRLSEQEMQEKK